MIRQSNDLEVLAGSRFVHNFSCLGLQLVTCRADGLDCRATAFRINQPL